MSRGSRVMLFLLGSAYCWLLIGSLLVLFAAFKLVWPAFLAESAWLSFGRLESAGVDALVYGWASTVGLALAMWLLGRLGRASYGPAVLPAIAAIFWNVGLGLGVGGILAGWGGSFFLLEMPGFAAAILWAAYLALAAWGYVLFRLRARESLFVSSWYLVAALLWFPALYVTGNALLVWKPVAGSAQTPIAFWFASGVVGLWLAPLALACVYYLIPQILGRRVAAYERSALGFWLFGLLAPWLGLAQLAGGPVPAWLAGAGTVAGILILAPVEIIAVSLFRTMDGAAGRLRDSLSLRLAIVSAGAFVLAYAEEAFLALSGVGGFLHFTDFVIGQGVLVLGGFVSTAFLALICFLVSESEGHPSRQGYWPFWLLIGGVAGMWVCFSLAGIAEGYVQSDPGFGFMTSVSVATPLRVLACFGLLSFLGGSFGFARGFFRSIFTGGSGR